MEQPQPTHSDPILVVGASGATGRLVVQELLDRGQRVKAVLRAPNECSATWQAHPNYHEVQASVHALSPSEWDGLLRDCGAAVSCLGHNLNFKGMYGKPRRLVTDVTRRICEAAAAHERSKPFRFVLMNTTGHRNADRDERISLPQKAVIGLLRHLVPPHADNEQAAEYLRTQIGQQHARIEWVAVRPDGLTREETVGRYELHASPTRSAIFNAGKTRRIQVAHFMAELLTSAATWNEWRGAMPVIYDVTDA